MKDDARVLDRMIATVFGVAGPGPAMRHFAARANFGKTVIKTA